MDAGEVTWRGTTAARTLFDRTRTRLAAPRWSRTDLLRLLAPLDELTAVRAALKAQRWPDAQRELGRHFARAPRRFAIGPQSRPAMAERIRREFPDAARHATGRADRILDGEYDLLGYRGLRFDSPDLPHPRALPDWHLDPVHACSVPRTFWSTVPYLDPACGDHKIIWELNRHQHWLALGRAFWLTDDRRYRERCIAELTSWLDANPPRVGVNWASMLELAFRSLSWLWAINLFADADAEDASPWLVDLLLALDRQLAHVEQNLSHYFSPNTHLTGEALGLFYLGTLLPEFRRANRWRRLGWEILERALPRHVHDDGVYFEQSTYYHRYTIDIYLHALVLAERNDSGVSAGMHGRLGMAAQSLADFMRPDGTVPIIGDDDGGRLVALEERECTDVRSALAAASVVLRNPSVGVLRLLSITGTTEQFVVEPEPAS